MRSLRCEIGRVLLMLLPVASLILLAPRAFAGTTFDIGPYFPLDQGNTYHYTGDGQQGSTIEDDFTYAVQPTLVDVGGGVMATRIRTTTDEASDDRNMDEDFFQFDAVSGELIFWGFRNGVADNCFPVQDVILSDPIVIGMSNMTIGQVVTDTGSGSVETCLGSVSGMVTSSITYVEFVPSLDTPLGTFNDVLHLIIEINGTATITDPFPTNVPFEIRNIEVWLKEGVGMIQQDQNADPDDAQIQAIDGGMVNGAPIVPDGGTPTPTPTDTPTPTPTDTPTPTPTDTPTPTPTDTPTPTPTDTPTPTPTGTPTPTPTATPPPPACVMFNVMLDGDQETPPVTTDATGTATVIVDTVINRLSYSIMFSGLSSAQTLAHIHGYSARGVASAPVHDISLGNSVVGFWDYPEDAEADILAGLTYINIHTVDFGNGEIRGQIDNGVPCSMTTDFTIDGGNDHGFIGGAVPGFGGSASVSPTGLCMSVPDTGDNLVIWASPEGYIELISNTIYCARIDASTDTVNPDSIPLFFYAYDNFFSSGMGNNYGGFSWVLDVAGGAQGLGRAQGLNELKFISTPNAVELAPWNGIAFTAQNDPINDMRALFEVIDANASLLTDNDFGNIYVSSIEISAIPRDVLSTMGTPFNPVIDSSTHYASNVFSSPGTTAIIDDVNDFVSVQMGTTGDVRVEIGYFDPEADGVAGGQFGPLELYPVVWGANMLYRARSRVSPFAAVVEGSGASISPVDSVLLAIDTATNELGSVHFSTAGSGSMFQAASPSSAGQYESYFYSHNATLSAVPDSGRLRPLVFFFNTDAINGPGTGGDPFAVSSLELDIMVAP